MLQGSTYKLPITILDKEKNVVIDDTIVSKAVFTIGDIEKKYGLDGDVTFDKEKNAWIIPLSEQETFSLKGNIKWQARFLFTNGEVDGIEPKFDNVIESINKTILSEG